MVSPHSEWTDLENGYRRENTGVFVNPAHVRIGEGSSYHVGGVDPEDANAYSVDVRTALETAGETWDTIAHFKEPRPAWEFANLLTHYFEAKTEPFVAKNELLREDDPNYPGDSDTLPEIVEERNGQEAFLIQVQPAPVPEPVHDLLDDKYKVSHHR